MFVQQKKNKTVLTSRWFGLLKLLNVFYFYWNYVKISLFTPILDKILPLTNKVLKIFLFFFILYVWPHTPFIFSLLVSWIENFKNCWSEVLGIQILCFICKTNRTSVLLDPVNSSYRLYFFSPENTHLQVNVSCLFFLFVHCVLFQVC